MDSFFFIVPVPLCTFCGGNLGFGFIITILNHAQWDIFESPIISFRDKSFVVTRFSILKFALIIKHPCSGFVLWCGQALYFVLPSEGATIDGGKGKTSVFWEPAATKNLYTHILTRTWSPPNLSANSAENSTSHYLLLVELSSEFATLTEFLTSLL